VRAPWCGVGNLRASKCVRAYSEACVDTSVPIIKTTPNPNPNTTPLMYYSSDFYRNVDFGFYRDCALKGSIKSQQQH